jgi:hypothetical protein
MISRSDGKWTRGFFEVPVLHEPGTHFLYNTGATYMLSAIVQKTTGMKLLDYLQPRLFEPLGIQQAKWDESPQGINVGGTGLHIKTEDIARFGQLYLQKGRWNGHQILPEAWIEEATRSHISNGDDPASDWAQGYGYQFWRSRHGLYRGDGAFGQYCIVMPEQDAVLAMTGGVDDMQKPLNLVWELLLPAMQSDTLPDDAAAHETLTNKLSGLTIHPVQGQLSSPIASEVSERTYKVDDNEFKFETITMNFDGSGCTISVKAAGDEESFPCGYSAWQQSQTSVFDEPWLLEPSRIVASGAWTADDTFTMIVRFYETSFYRTLVCHFAGDELMIETRVNVSFGSTKPVLLTAHRV